MWEQIAAINCRRQMSTEAPRDQLTTALRDDLLFAARAARERAYAPYSGFQVGAAVLDEHGRIHAGCNVGNAAYPEGMCAEAGALSAMVLAGGRVAKAVAVVGAGTRWVTPCGGCRQKLREFGAPDMPVLVANPEQLHATLRLEQLLPYSFGPENLEPSP